MKPNITLTKKSNAGMTLLELTVVILVLLSLISILFIGARAWKKGSDRSANIMNIRSTQQSMRSHQNMYALNEGATFTTTELEEYQSFPQAVNSDVTYTEGTEITATSDVPATTFAHIWIVPSAAGLPTADYGHTSFADVTGW